MNIDAYIQTLTIGTGLFMIQFRNFCMQKFLIPDVWELLFMTKII